MINDECMLSMCVPRIWARVRCRLTASVRFCELSGRKPVGQVSLVPPIEFRQQIAVARLTHSASNFYFVLIHYNHPVSGEFGERR